MALLAILTIIFWIRWERMQGRRWLVAACASLPARADEQGTRQRRCRCCSLSTPSGSRNTASHRASAMGAMALVAVAVLALRAHAGALMLAAFDAHYNLTTPFSRWVRNGRNYFERMIPSPLALLLTAGIPIWLTAPRGTTLQRGKTAVRPLAIFAGAWFLVFILPVLPIAGRSELYLYLPGFGLCLLVGALLSRLSPDTRSGWIAAAISVYVAAVGSYQLSRIISVHRDAQFSTQLVKVLGRHDALRTYAGAVVVVPEGSRDRGTLEGIDRRVSRRGPAGDARQDRHRRRCRVPTTPAVIGGLRLTCAFRNGQILLYSTAAGPDR